MDKYQKLAELIESGNGSEILDDDMDVTIFNLRKAGMDFSRSELEDMVKAYLASKQDEELDESSLEAVAGGAINPFKGIRLKDIFSKGNNNWFNKYLGNLEKITRGY